MPYAVVLYLDTQISNPIQQTILELAQRNIAPYMQVNSVQPHVTLAIFDDLDCQTCEIKISRLARKIKVFDLNFAYLGIFHSESTVVYLGPTSTQELLSMHSRLHEILKNDATRSWDLYQPGNWVPHCSLAVEFPPQKLQKAVQICMKIMLPLSVPIASLGVMQFEPLQPLYDYAIQGSDLKT